MAKTRPCQSAADVVAGRDLSPKVALVTGASSGLGFATAQALAGAGASLILPTRNLEQGCAVADKLVVETGNSRIRSYRMDLAEHASVRRFTEAVLEEYPRLDILINNAGIMACPQELCPQGYELHFSVNHLGHFLLTTGLWPALSASPECRVVCLSAAAHRLSSLCFDDPHFEQRPYDKWLAYAQSKTANALFAMALDRRLPREGWAFAVNPGAAATRLRRYLPREEMQSTDGPDSPAPQPLLNPAQGAATTVWAACSPVATRHGGVYCEDCGPARLIDPGEQRGRNEAKGVYPHARDPEAAERLWESSERLVSLRAATDLSLAMHRSLGSRP